MKINLAPGEKLTISFYIPADEENNSGWGPPQDQSLDGDIIIEHREDAIAVSADLEDDSNRGGDKEAIIYYSSGYAAEDEEAEEIDAQSDDRYPGRM